MTTTKISKNQATGLTDGDVAASNIDGSAATPSMRTLGTGAQQACAGNDSRLSDTRVPTQSYVDNTVCQGRLTLTSGTPYPTADVAASNSLFFAPSDGNRIALYDGTNWNQIIFNQTGVVTTPTARSTATGGVTTSGSPTVTGLSSTTGVQAGDPIASPNFATGTVVLTVNSSSSVTLSTNATANGTNQSVTFYFATYDVFAYNNAGTLAFDNLLAWTANNTRATNLSTQDGIIIKAGDSTRRYIGTVQAVGVDGTGKCLLYDVGFPAAGTPPRRLVWNYYNRIRRPFVWTDSASSWTYGTAAWRQANGNPNAYVDIVVGFVQAPVHLVHKQLIETAAGGTTAGISIGRGSITPITHSIGGAAPQVSTTYLTFDYVVEDLGYSAGRTPYWALEDSQGNVNVTFINSTLSLPNGITGWVEG